MLELCTLASGSSGNCLLASDGTTPLLIDAGLSARRICKRLRALGVEPASRHIMEHPPRRVNNLLDGPLARRVIFQGVFIAALALVAFVIGQNAGSYELGCTMAFGVLGFSQVLRSLNQRSATDPVWDREGARNRQLGLAAAASIALMLVVLLVPPFIDAFGGTTMDLGQWALVVGFALLSVVQTEIAKAIGRWRARR